MSTTRPKNLRGFRRSGHCPSILFHLKISLKLREIDLDCGTYQHDGKPPLGSQLQLSLKGQGSLDENFIRQQTNKHTSPTAFDTSIPVYTTSPSTTSHRSATRPAPSSPNRILPASHNPPKITPLSKNAHTKMSTTPTPQSQGRNYFEAQRAELIREIGIVSPPSIYLSIPPNSPNLPLTP